MKLQDRIHQKLSEALAPQYLEVLNESHQHNVPSGSETHFKVTVVSLRFQEMKMLARHREIYHLLAQEMEAGVHALALHTMTPLEWENETGSRNSPPCLGGSKKKS